MSQYLLKAVGTEQEKNKGLTRTNQGGEAYAIDCFSQARRFLILGTEGGSFYASEQKLTAQNIVSIGLCLDADGRRLIDMIVEISDKGLAPKNDPALLALAMAASYANPAKEQYATDIRTYAFSVLPKVARTGTHLFHFAAYADNLRGWGSALRKGIGRWYTDRSDFSLINQVTKYVQRDGWSHADLLRLSHPNPKNTMQDTIFKYVVDGIYPVWAGEGDSRIKFGNKVLDYINAVEEVKQETNIAKIIDLTRRYELPREVLPTQVLSNPAVWDALLPSMGFTAMVRNLGTMSKVGLLVQGSDAATFVINRLHDEEQIRSGRMHPIDFIKAKLTYQSGSGYRSDSTWTVVRPVVDALESAFYLSFGNVVPTGKRTLVALDVSGSMGGGQVAGVPGFTPAMATACLSMVNIRVERDAEVLGFTNRLIDLGISKHDSLNAAMTKVVRNNWGGTDCGLPFTYALQANKNFDAFCVYTDNDTGHANPIVRLREYRRKSGIHDAKLVVCGMVANNFTIADPTDVNMLDVVGFDSSVPQVLSAFIRGDV